MSRYIDAEELIKKLNNGFDWIKDTLCGDFQSGALANLTDVINTISNKQLVPTADVKPIVRGEWELHKDGSGTCNVCGTTQKAVWDMDSWQNFCPHCGTDMRGEKE